MAESALDRNLLFGMIALRMDFVSRDALIAALRTWSHELDKPLDQVLVERGALAEDERSLLDPLVGKHLELLGDDAERQPCGLELGLLDQARRGSPGTSKVQRTSTLPTATPRASPGTSTFRREAVSHPEAPRSRRIGRGIRGARPRPRPRGGAQADPLALRRRRLEPRPLRPRSPGHRRSGTSRHRSGPRPGL